MRDIDVHEAMSNLNPCSSKMGRDADFKDAMSAFVEWTDNEIKTLKERIKVLEHESNSTTRKETT
tara:strand:- start:273 stop:467 length:195 start_codon:yes stop_codon:yes gene_type:complete